MAFPFINPFALPPMAPPPPGLIGKTQYHYVTKDGGPPNQGKPPSPVGAGPPPPPYAFIPPAAPCGPAPPPGGPFVIPPGPSHPGMVCFPNGAGPAPGPGPQAPGFVWVPAAPAPAPIPPFGGPPPPPFQAAAPGPAAPPGPEPPVSGNRIKDNLVVMKESGGVGYISSKNNATFHVFNRGLLSVYTPDANNRIYIPAYANEAFRVQVAACSMPMEELIEQLDCIKDAPANWPRSQIGVAEMVDLGAGWFEVGTKFMLDEPRSKETIAQIWGRFVGEAGLAPPRYLTRIP